MSVIKREDHLSGIRYWAQWYFHRVPNFEVFKYVGHDKSAGLHYFQSIKTRAIIAKSFYQLNVNGFKPFCLDWKRISEVVENAPV